MKQYYKILHEDLKHYNMQYHLGLNEDIKPFNPEPKYDGGIFFADKEHVLDYLKYSQGTKLAVVEVPEEEQIVKINEKYKAHKIIIKDIQSLWSIENYEWLKKYFSHDTMLFDYACENGALEFAKWLYKQGNINIHANDDKAFTTACTKGHLEFAKWLYDLGGINIRFIRKNFFANLKDYELEN